MLDAHFCAGDGRVNENIALTTIHQVFHSEHDRLVGDIQQHAGRQPRPARRLRGRRPERRQPGRPDLRLRGPAVPGGPLRHRDGVPAPRVRGVRPQGAAGDPAVPRLLTPTSTRLSRRSSRTRSTGSATRCSTTRSPATRPRRRRQLRAAAARRSSTRRSSSSAKNGGALTPEQAAGQRRDGVLGPDRQRARRVRHRDAPQQPAGAPSRPAHAQHGPGPGRRRALAERPASAALRRDQRRPAHAVHQLVGLRPAPEAPRVAGQLRGRLRHPPDHPRLDAPGSGTRRGQGVTIAERAAARAIVDPLPGARPARSPPPDASAVVRCRHRRLRPGGRPTVRPTTTRVSTRSTCGSAASRRSPTSSAACSAARSTTCSRPRWRACRTVTGSTT